MGGFCLLAGQVLPPLQWLESRLYDLRVYFQRQPQPSSDILLLHLTSDQLGPLLRHLQQLPAPALKALGLDLPEAYGREIEHLLEFTPRFNFPRVISARLKSSDTPSPAIYRHVGSLEKRWQTAFADYLPDADGILRQQPVHFLYRTAEGKQLRALPAFSWALYASIQPKGKKPPVPPRSSLIHFVSPQQSLPVLNFQEFQQLAPQTLRGKILIAGDSRQVLNLETPLHIRTSRLELHGQTLSGWLNRTYYRHPPLLNLLMPLLLAMASLAILTMTLRWGLLISGLSVTTLLFSYFSLNIFCFQYLNIWLDLSAPILAMLLSAGAVTVFFNRTEGQRRAAILSTFRRHLPDEMVRELLEHSEPENLTLHERRVVTVMFTDIKGFSRMGEKLPPDQIIRILNEYLTAMTDIVFNNQGTLDKYIGDGIMAVYGNIGENNPRQNAYYAVKTALEMRIEMERLQKKWMHEGLRPIQIRIGINSGEALVGYVGHPKRKEVTVIGDTVNTASRIEKLNKKYHTHILISHSTYEYVKDWMDAVPLGEEKLTGKSSSVKIYEIRGWKDENIQA